MVFPSCSTKGTAMTIPVTATGKRRSSSRCRRHRCRAARDMSDQSGPSHKPKAGLRPAPTTTLPVDLTRSTAAVPTDPIDQARFKVVVVDDSRAFRMSLCSKLRLCCGAQLELLEAPTVSAASQIIMRSTPDVIFLDAVFEGQSRQGVDLIAELSSGGAARDFPIIFCSAWGQHTAAPKSSRVILCAKSRLNPRKVEALVSQFGGPTRKLPISVGRSPEQTARNAANTGQTRRAPSKKWKFQLVNSYSIWDDGGGFLELAERSLMPKSGI